MSSSEGLLTIKINLTLNKTTESYFIELPQFYFQQILIKICSCIVCDFFLLYITSTQRTMTFKTKVFIS